MSDELGAAKLAVAAATTGALARVALALHGGARGVRLAVEGFVGACLGLIAAGIAIYVDPTLRDAGWPILSVSAAAGLAGALGTRALDIAEAAIRRRWG